MRQTVGTIIGFICIGASFLACHSPKPVVIPPAIDGSACRMPIVVTSEGVCVDYFTPNHRACVRCGGATACVAEDFDIYCVDEKLGCLDPLCTKVTAPPSKR